MSYRVYLTQEAEKDLLDVHAFVAVHDSPDKADVLLERLESTCADLTRLPHRGHVPPELKRVGVESYRELHFKPYRVIYEIVGQQVFVHAVLDGRRDLQSWLERRQLR
jgi:toxin ParE1/3/4